MAVEPIRWKGDSLELLDQRLLPDQLSYVTCRTAEEVAAAIRDMVVRGAPAIGCAAAFGFVLGRGSEKSFQILAASRPTAVNLFWALERMKKAKDLKAAFFPSDLSYLSYVDVWLPDDAPLFESRTRMVFAMMWRSNRTERADR